MNMKERTKNINTLIKLISNLERKFYLNEETKELCSFRVEGTKIFFKDSSFNKEGQIRAKHIAGDLNPWVNGGHTLRCQIIEFAQHIRTGDAVQILSRYWGISKKSQIKLTKVAVALHITDWQESYSFYDYTLSKTIKFKI